MDRLKKTQRILKVIIYNPETISTYMKSLPLLYSRFKPYFEQKINMGNEILC